MKQIRIATRASRLALWQSNYVKGLLEELDPEVSVTLVEISTKGDRDTSDFLYKSQSMGFFTSEVENALLDGRADLAVHSFKDLPTATADALVVAAIPKRESVCDALVASGDVKSIGDLPAGASVGTSSLRRIGQLKQIRSDLNCQPLRGNVETRVGKVESGEVDAIIIAEAGLNRLGLSDKISAVLDPAEFPTAPAQGALAIQIRKDEPELGELVGQLDDRKTRIGALTERRILAAMHGGCSIPLGVYSKIKGDTITMKAVVTDPDSSNVFTSTASGKVADANKLAAAIAAELLESGAAAILEKVRAEKS
jgi:hydroxymethylbilane synthase